MNHNIAPITRRALSPSDGPRRMAAVSKYVNLFMQEAGQEILEQPTYVAYLHPGPIPEELSEQWKPLSTLLKEAYKRLDTRSQHSLRYLQRKNLKKTTVRDLAKFIENTPDNLTTAALHLLTIVLSGSEKPSLKVFPKAEHISDETYEMAIELAMLNTETDTMYSPELYGPLLEKHLGLIYTLAVLLHYSKIMIEKGEEWNEDFAKINEAAEQYGGYENAIAHVTAEPEEIEARHRQELDDLKSTLEAQHKAEIDRLKAQLKAAEAATKPTEAKLRKANKKLDQTAEQLSKTQRQLEAMYQFAETRSNIIERLLQILPETNYLPDLPDNIAVVGGAKSVITGLRAKYPAWKFIDGTDKHASITSKPDCVFLLPVHLYHSTVERIQKTLDPKTPLVQITGANVGLIENKMKTAYANIVAAQPETKQE